ncbi:serine hydrolase domain-containing protein [Microbacterium sp.]|uniref:serine hydrolase domain-containing protein n=1 Tax=Microbacterium sp. TaxID=51671 RepID=UPI003A94BCB3
MHLRSSRRLRAAVVGATALIVALTGCTSSAPEFTYDPPQQVNGQLPDDLTAQMQAAVEQAITATGASGAIVGVWVPWSGEWVTGFGTQAKGDDTKVTKDMSFRIADVTRMMTCDVLYGMADDGKVKLDAPVTKYVSGVADLSDITLLDLCNGTSGVGSSEAAVKPYLLNTPDRVWAPLQLASFGLGQQRGPAHTAYRDSDAGYLMLGMALERISGESASQLISQYVTTPLGLKSTSLPGAAGAVPKPAPALKGAYLPLAEDGTYDCAKPVDITESSASIGYTDSGVVSTITDLGRYAQAEARQALRAKDAKPARFASPLPAAPGAPAWYQATGGAYLVGSMIGQHGWVPGYATSAYSDPATGFTVAVTLNDSSAGSAPAAYLAWELAAIASKAPAAKGQTAPQFGLPFTAEQYAQQMTNAAICQPPAQ